MTMNGKRDQFTIEDLKGCGRVSQLIRGEPESIIEEIRTALLRWPEFAQEAKVDATWTKEIQNNFRLTFPKS